MKLPDMPTALATALAQAESDWHMNVGEHDRKSGSRLDQMFQLSGYSRFGVPKGLTDKVPDWCGMAVVSWLIAGGFNRGFNTSFLHTFNVEAFFTYGKPRAFNSNRLDRRVVVNGIEQPIDQWHRSHKASRRWLNRTAIADGLLDVKTPNPDLFRPGDVVLIDWSGRDEADHITIVSQWDAETRQLHTWEGNRSGKGHLGDAIRDAVVPCVYDLTVPLWRRRLYGAGRLSPLDFGSEVVR